MGTHDTKGSAVSFTGPDQRTLRDEIPQSVALQKALCQRLDLMSSSCVFIADFLSHFSNIGMSGSVLWTAYQHTLDDLPQSTFVIVVVKHKMRPCVSSRLEVGRWLTMPTETMETFRRGRRIPFDQSLTNIRSRHKNTLFSMTTSGKNPKFRRSSLRNREHSRGRGRGARDGRKRVAARI